jgi:hypothetical protein
MALSDNQLGSRLSFQWIVRVICITVSVRQMEHGSPVSSTSEALACFEPEGNPEERSHG